MRKQQKIAVIGLGAIGKTIAQNLVRGNRQIIIAGRKFEDAKILADELGDFATAKETSEAIKIADIVILSVWFDTIHELFEEFSLELQNKIIIDPSNPIAPDENGGFRKIIGEKESAGILNSAKLPQGAKLAKAFGTLGASSLAEGAFQTPQNVLFYASDNEEVDEEIEQLIHDSGYDALKVGGLDQSIRIEVFGDLHEFGALGRLVKSKEALAKI